MKLLEVLREAFSERTRDEGIEEKERRLRELERRTEAMRRRTDAALKARRTR